MIRVLQLLYRTIASPAATKAAAAKEPPHLDAAPVNSGLFGKVADGDAVGTIGDPVATGGTIALVPVLPAVPAAVPVAKPEEPPETPVELPEALNHRLGIKKKSQHLPNLRSLCARARSVIIGRGIDDGVWGIGWRT